MELNKEKIGKVFITGHTGFKGTWLTLLLESFGIEVVGYSLAPTQDGLYMRLNREGKIQETFGDIRDFSNMEAALKEASPSHIFHLAAQALVLDSYEKPIETFETNVLGTANLLQAARKVPNLQRIGVITTDKVYENQGKGRAFVETDPLGADDPYSASKVSAESAIRAWRTIYERENDADILALRAGNVIGGGDLSANRLVPDIIRARYFDEELKIRYPKGTRPWQHVLDPLLGYVSAILLQNEKKHPEFDSFNFGPSNESLTVSQVIEIAEDHWRQNLRVNILPQNEQNYEASLLDLDSSKANKLLGWQPIWSQKEAVISTLNWWDSVLAKDTLALESCLEDIRFASASKN